MGFVWAPKGALFIAINCIVFKRIIEAIMPYNYFVCSANLFTSGVMKIGLGFHFQSGMLDIHVFQLVL